jgi:Ca-activated chloride channel family protein
MIPAVTHFARAKTLVVIACAVGVVATALALTKRRSIEEVPPKPPVTTNGPVDVGGLSLNARPTSNAILRGSSETHLAVTITTPAAPEHRRGPIALAVVLDTSGSMDTAAKIEHAKSAARHVIDQLRDDDRFALITFSNQAEVLMPLTAATPDAKQRATAAIGGVYAEGSTNISDALQVGTQALAVGGDDDRMRRVVLISDGKPEKFGILDADQLISFAGKLGEQGTSISTVGVGLDFDEKIMTGIAVVARGNYYFVEDTNQLATMFDHELDSLGATVATDATLTITPAAGVDVLETYGYQSSFSGGATIVPISDLRGGETRKLVVRVRVNATASSSMDLAKVTLTYRPRDGRAAVSASAMASVAITDDNGVVEAGLDRDAVRQVEQARTGDALDQATEAYQQGDTDKAREILNRRAAEAKTAAGAIADPALANQIDDVTKKTAEHFAAPPSAAPGMRAAKQTRADAYELTR